MPARLQAGRAISRYLCFVYCSFITVFLSALLGLRDRNSLGRLQRSAVFSDIQLSKTLKKLFMKKIFTPPRFVTAVFGDYITAVGASLSTTPFFHKRRSIPEMPPARCRS